MNLFKLILRHLSSANSPFKLSFRSKLRRTLTNWISRGFSGWTITVGTIALLVSTPILAVVLHLFIGWGKTADQDSSSVWQHLAETVLPSYIQNSLLLMLGVGLAVLIMGISTAWLVTVCRFPGSRWLEWLLLLPLASPAYLLAYIYTEFLDYYGGVQLTLRQWFGWQSIQDYWFPEIRSLGGAIALLALSLYPYVYLLARVAFLEQSSRTLEASRALGCSPWRAFWQVALPLARPSLAAGLALALMETLSDFGTVEFFGIPTFTTGIYRTWLGMGERTAALQLAAVLLLFIVVLIAIERWSRNQSRYYQGATHRQPFTPYRLGWLHTGLAWLVCGLPVLGGFGLPLWLIVRMTLKNTTENFTANFWQLAQNSLLLASVTALLGVILALVMAYGQRLQPTGTMTVLVRLASLGYAMPGSVVAVGILMPLGQFDNLLADWLAAQFDLQVGLLLSGTIAALIFAYLVRFLTLSFETVESSLGKIQPSLDDAARSLGHSPLGTLWRIHVPLLRGGVLTAVMLLFVDVMKELSATLVIRPFNFETLATQVYRYASDERLVEAAAPALAILVVGIIPVIFLTVEVARSRPVS